MSSGIHPGDGTHKLTGTGTVNNGRKTYVKIDGDEMTVFHRKYDWVPSSGVWVNQEDSTDFFKFRSDGTGIASLNGTGHSFDHEPSSG